MSVGPRCREERVSLKLGKTKRIFLRIWHWRVGHKWEFVRNIYGDEINYRGGARSIYRCIECGKNKWCPGLAGSYLNLPYLPELSQVTLYKGPTIICSTAEATTATDRIQTTKYWGIPE